MKLKYIGMLILGIGLAFLYFYINPSTVNFLPKCTLYQTTGIYCPGCGSQRATHHLLNLNITGVLQQNILFVAGLIIFGYYLTIKGVNYFFKKNIYLYTQNKKVQIAIFLFILVFWILRNIPEYPFNLLAPN